MSMKDAIEVDAILDENKYPFKREVGILRFLVDSTLPDLAYVVGELSRNMHQPVQMHWRVL